MMRELTYKLLYNISVPTGLQAVNDMRMGYEGVETIHKFGVVGRCRYIQELKRVNLKATVALVSNHISDLG